MGQERSGKMFNVFRHMRHRAADILSSRSSRCGGFKWSGKPLGDTTVNWIEAKRAESKLCKYFQVDVQFANAALGNHACGVVGIADKAGYCMNCYSKWRHHKFICEVDRCDCGCPP